MLYDKLTKVGEEDFLAIFEISYFRAIAKNFFFCQS